MSLNKNKSRIELFSSLSIMCFFSSNSSSSFKYPIDINIIYDERGFRYFLDDDNNINTNSSNLSNPLEFDSGKLELATGWNFSKNSSLKGYGVELTYTRELYGENILEGNTIQLGIDVSLVGIVMALKILLESLQYILKY